VAGTNGKGSTTAFLCKILEQTGKKVGMFTSPHLVEFGERIRINGEYIPKEEITRIGNLLLNCEFQLAHTMFDYCLAMAVIYFKEQGCDILVLETGIGGRYDSTNAIGVPEVAVITKIGLDHTAILGDTIEEIAMEKAGIMKKGAPVVISTQQESVRRALYDHFHQVNEQESTMISFGEMSNCKVQMRKDETAYMANLYEVSAEDIAYAAGIPMKMMGSYQLENAATAVLAARVLMEKWQKEKVFQATQDEIEGYIRDGIAQTFWKGRMELISEHPFFMIDGAHNAHGVHALAVGLKELYPGEKFHFIMGVMADKDYEDMIQELLPLALDFVTVTPESSRALQSKDLAECIAEKGVNATYSQDMESVILPLIMGEGPVEKTIAFGSLYFIGAIEAILEKNRR
jgi:dihydrofolate synthase/folylpolyglutamate synthase